MPAHLPEVMDRLRQPQLQLGVARLREPFTGGPQILVLPLHAVQPSPCCCPAYPGLGLRQGTEMAGMPPPPPPALPLLPQLPARILPQRLQQPEAPGVRPPLRASCSRARGPAPKTRLRRPPRARAPPRLLPLLRHEQR